jgi:hypothetical protein
MAYQRTFWESVAAIGFLAAVLLLACLWRLTLQRAEKAPLSHCQWAWNVTVFVGWLALMAMLGVAVLHIAAPRS